VTEIWISQFGIYNISVCNFSVPPSHTSTFLTPDPLPRFTNTEYEDHICMSNKMSTHHQLFVTEGSTVITKKKPLVTCSIICEASEGIFQEVTRRPRVGHLACVMFAPTNSSREKTLYCAKLRQFQINFHWVMMWWMISGCTCSNFVLVFTLLYFECIKKNIYKGKNNFVRWGPYKR